MSVRLPIIGVIGSGSEAHQDRTVPLGRWIAAEGFHLLTGGGGGVMESVSRAFASVPGRRGLVIGVLPGSVEAAGYEPKAGYPNPWVEIPIRTHLPLSGERGADPMSRNHINVLSSDVIVAMPGGNGTASEVALSLEYGKPLIAYLQRRDQIPGLPAAVLVESDLQKLKAFVRSRL